MRWVGLAVAVVLVAVCEGVEVGVVVGLGLEVVEVDGREVVELGVVVLAATCKLCLGIAGGWGWKEGGAGGGWIGMAAASGDKAGGG